MSALRAMGVPVPAGQVPEHPGTAGEGIDVGHVAGREPLGDHLAGAELLVAELGVPVEVVSELDQGGQFLGDEGPDATDLFFGVHVLSVAAPDRPRTEVLEVDRSRPRLTCAIAAGSWRISRVSWLMVIPDARGARHVELPRVDHVEGLGQQGGVVRVLRVDRELATLPPGPQLAGSVVVPTDLGADRAFRAAKIAGALTCCCARWPRPRSAGTTIRSALLRRPRARPCRAHLAAMNAASGRRCAPSW